MIELTRRHFIRVSGTALAGSTLATMLDARRAPAQIRGTTLRMLKWSHFIPAYDQWFDKFAREWGEKNGVRVLVDHIPHLELPARYAAEFAAGAGHDLIYFVGQILTGHYYRNLVDVSDVASGLAKKYGGWMEGAKSCAQIGGVWYAIPDYFISIPVLWRKDLFDQAGLGVPDTWEKLRVAGRTLKARATRPASSSRTATTPTTTGAPCSTASGPGRPTRPGSRSSSTPGRRARRSASPRRSTRRA